MKENNTISKKYPQEKSMDYEFLRNKGFEYIEKLSSQEWTDYNVHDPGITILESLCYAITDLGYRTNYSMEDILASKNGTDESTELNKYFYTAAKIMPCMPVTETDLRKLMIDIKVHSGENKESFGIKNAWIFKCDGYVLDIDCNEEKFTVYADPAHKINKLMLNGIYQIIIEPDFDKPDTKGLSDGDKKKIEDEYNSKVNKLITKAKEVYHRNRNLCEDLDDISVVDEQGIIVCANIEISPGSIPEDVYSEILFQLIEYLSPSVRRYSLDEMLEKKKEEDLKYSTDEIYEGPFLMNGFIDDTELNQTCLKTEIYTSEIINKIMGIPDVISVKEIALNYCGTERLDRNNEWCLKIPYKHKPKLCINESVIKLMKDVIPMNINWVLVMQKLNQKIESNNENLTRNTADLQVPKGENRNIDFYNSITHQFPVTYGIGNAGLPLSASDQRKALSKQLKAYLLFYDQILCNYLKQLSNVRNLFSVYKTYDDGTFKKITRTYFTKAVNDIKDIEVLYHDYSMIDTELEKLSETQEIFWKRRNHFLEHLLSRFAENFNENTMKFYVSDGEIDYYNLINDMEIFLLEYPDLSYNRTGGFDYYNNSDESGNELLIWDTENVSGLEHRLCRLLGLESYSRTYLSDIKPEVYQEKDEDGIDEYRFRLIEPGTNKILLSSSTRYYSESSCINEFKAAAMLAANIKNYELKTADDGRFYFNIVDRTGEVVARRIEYYDTKKERNAAIDHLINFINKHNVGEGLFVIEHILLRPEKEWIENPLPSDPDYFLPVCLEGDCSCEDDPYSFRITVILPAEAPSFTDTNRRDYIEKIIRMETPSHIYPKVCWASNLDITNFEAIFRKWLEAKHNPATPKDEMKLCYRNLIQAMYQIKNVYPKAILNDCSGKEPPFVLGKNILGNN